MKPADKKNHIITVLDLPEDEWIYVDKEGLIRSILERVIFRLSPTIRGSYKKITKLTGFSKWFISKLHRKDRRKIKIFHLKLLLSILPSKEQKDIVNNIHSHIVKIGHQNSIIKSKLPINFASVEGANFLGDLLTDGSLNSNYQVTYCNSNLKMLTQNLQMINKLFVGKEVFVNGESISLEDVINRLVKRSAIKCTLIKHIKVNKDGINRCYQLVYSNVLGKIINKNLKIPKGKRVYTNPKIPGFLLTASKLSSAFIGRVFLNEGHVEAFGATITHSMDLTPIKKKLGFEDAERFKAYIKLNKHLFAPKLLWGYKDIFYLLGCKKPSEPYLAGLYTTSKGEFRAKWNIYVGGEDIRVLLNEVKFGEKFRTKLLDYIYSVKYFKINKKLRTEKIIETGKIIQTSKNYFTVKDIANDMALDKTTIQKHLKRARANNLIQLAGKAGNAYIYRVKQW
jgi:hypothetical protein